MVVNSRRLSSVVNVDSRDMVHIFVYPYSHGEQDELGTVPLNYNSKNLDTDCDLFQIIGEIIGEAKIRSEYLNSESNHENIEYVNPISEFTIPDMHFDAYLHSVLVYICVSKEELLNGNCLEKAVIAEALRINGALTQSAAITLESIKYVRQAIKWEKEEKTA